MSTSIRDRYDDPGLAHCWVRTHSMVDDLKKCMRDYQACGGKYDPKALWGWRVRAAINSANEADPPSVVRRSPP